MMLQRVAPILYTTALDSSRLFYCQTLGFTCTGGDPQQGWMSLERDGVQLMMTLPNDHLPFKEPIFTGSLYFYIIEDIDHLWNELQGKVKVAYPLEDFEYGMREFAIYDNNGYMLQFGQIIDL